MAESPASRRLRMDGSPASLRLSMGGSPTTHRLRMKERVFSADTSPMMLNQTGRPSSARLYRRQRKISRCSATDDPTFSPSLNTTEFHWDDFYGHRRLDGGLTPPSSRCSPSPSSHGSAPIGGGHRQLQQENSSLSPKLSNNFDDDLHEEIEELDGAVKTEEEVAVEQEIAAIRKKQRQRLACGQMRSFNVDSQGRIVDCGFRRANANGKLFKAPPAALAPRNNKSRRATCPEIWLSTADEVDGQREATKCVVRIYGCARVGKKSVARQLFASADASQLNESDENEWIENDADDLNKPSRHVSFLMNEEEIDMEIIQGSALESNPFQNVLTIYMVVYSVDDKESFSRATQILYRLNEKRAKPSAPLILVANKVDLQRRRRITSIEGKMLSKVYKCPFVEISAMLSMNIESLWRETLHKVQKHKLALEKCEEISPEEPCEGGKIKRKNSSRFVGRIVDGTRRFAKSCEELVARMVAASPRPQ